MFTETSILAPNMHANFSIVKQHGSQIRVQQRQNEDVFND